MYYSKNGKKEPAESFGFGGYSEGMGEMTRKKWMYWLLVVLVIVIVILLIFWFMKKGKSKGKSMMGYQFW